MILVVGIATFLRLLFSTSAGEREEGVESVFFSLEEANFLSSNPTNKIKNYCPFFCSQFAP